MAHTYRDLWSKLIAWDNLLAAYRKCRRRKRHTGEAVTFDFAWENHLVALQRELTTGTYRPAGYRHFQIREPKPRIISAAPFRDRVVHHAIVRVLEPIFERRFIFDSYACRRHKGTHRAILRAHSFVRRYPFFLKTDIVRFFPNIDHAVLLGRIARVIRDERVLELIRLVLQSGAGVLASEATNDLFPGDDLFALLRPKGLPIGNLTSQFFANLLLDPIDHFVKEELRVPGYVRYADDLVLFANSKQALWAMRDALSGRLAGLRLRLHQNKTHVDHAGAGLRFLGFVLRPQGRRLYQAALARFNRRVRRLRWLFARGETTAEAVRRSLQAWRAHAAWANTTGIRRVLWRRLRLRRGGAVGH